MINHSIWALFIQSSNDDLVFIAVEIHLFPCRTQQLSPLTPEVLGGCPLGDMEDAKLIWSVGQGVKTPPFHGGNTGSNPVRTIFSGLGFTEFCVIAD